MTLDLQQVLLAHFAPEHLSAVLDSIPMALSFTRLDDQVILCRNRTFKQAFGYEPDEFETIYDWFDTALPFPEDIALTLERWGPAVAAKDVSGQPVEPIEVRILCKNGTIKNVLHSGIVLPQANCVIATFVDLSTTRRDRPSPMVDLQAARAVDSASRSLPQLPPPCSPNPWEVLFAERRSQARAHHRTIELLDRTGRLAQVGGWEIDLLSGTVSWTEETHRIHAVPPGYRPTLESGLAFYARESRHLIRNAVEDAISGGIGWNVDAPLIRADGKRIWVRTQGSVEFQDGKPIRLFGAIQDVTARVAEQEALKQANERLVLATQSGQIGIYDWDMLNDNAVWDDCTFQLFGVDKSRGASYQAWSERLHPDDRQRAIDKIAEVIQSNELYEDEYRVLCPDGTTHHLRSKGQLTFNEVNTPTRFNGVLWDVTEQRHLAIERAEQDHFFRITLESIGEGVITTDAHGRVRWMNSVAERLTGWRMAEASGRMVADIYKIINEQTREPVQGALAECMARHETVTLAPDTILISRNGDEIAIDDSAAPITDASGNILGAVKVFHDVTEQRNLAREAQRVLQLDLRMKDEFLSHVSHELRSPLASIYSFASILADGLAGDVPPEQREYLDIILKNSRQLRSMIEDLLEVTRSETGKLSIMFEKTSVADAIAEAIETTQGSASSKGVSLSAQCSPSLAPAHADPTRLRQILINILDNATKFTHAGGNVHVSAAVSDTHLGMIEVRVADTGCGIPPEEAERIFEHLYQVPELSQESRKGLGLGLYIVRDLVARQGGTIWVQSEQGVGSQFTFTVPILRPSSGATARRPPGIKHRRSALV